MRGLQHLILLLFVAFAALSCDDDDNNSRGLERNPAPVTAAQGVEVAKVGETVEFQVSFQVRSACGVLGYFDKEVNGSTFTIYAHPCYTSDSCPQQSTTVTEKFHFTFDKPGTYTFKFWTGPDQFITKVVVAQ